MEQARDQGCRETRQSAVVPEAKLVKKGKRTGRCVCCAPQSVLVGIQGELLPVASLTSTVYACHWAGGQTARHVATQVGQAVVDGARKGKWLETLDVHRSRFAPTARPADPSATLWRRLLPSAGNSSKRLLPSLHPANANGQPDNESPGPGNRRRRWADEVPRADVCSRALKRRRRPAAATDCRLAIHPVTAASWRDSSGAPVHQRFPVNGDPRWLATGSRRG